MPVNEDRDSSRAAARPLEQRPTAVAASPWSVNFGEAYKIKDAKGDTIAMMNFVHLNGLRDAREVAASARLIAAAPDMKRALQMCLSEFCGLTEKGAGQRLALAALAKAEDR